jgi:hypothetical protein
LTYVSDIDAIDKKSDPKEPDKPILSKQELEQIKKVIPKIPNQKPVREYVKQVHFKPPPYL